MLGSSDLSKYTVVPAILCRCDDSSCSTVDPDFLQEQAASVLIFLTILNFQDFLFCEDSVGEILPAIYTFPPQLHSPFSFPAESHHERTHTMNSIFSLPLFGDPYEVSKELYPYNIQAENHYKPLR